MTPSYPHWIVTKALPLGGKVFVGIYAAGPNLTDNKDFSLRFADQNSAMEFADYCKRQPGVVQDGGFIVEKVEMPS